MNSRRGLGICAAALWIAFLPFQAGASPMVEKVETAAQASLSDAEQAQLKAFSDRVKDYQKMEKALPADRLSPKSSVQQLEQERKALRDALQQARPNAKQGDLFTADVAPVFRKLLHATMVGPNGRKVRASLNRAEPIGQQDLKVNGVYPNLSGQPLQSVPPTLLFNLPVLPKGLEYRISGHTLAIRDADANMVVDYLPDAIP